MNDNTKKALTPFILTAIGILIFGINKALIDMSPTIDPENVIMSNVIFGTISAVLIIIGLVKTYSCIKKGVLNKKAFLIQIGICVAGFFLAKLVTILILILVFVMLVKSDFWLIIYKYLSDEFGEAVAARVVEAAEKEEKEQYEDF